MAVRTVCCVRYWAKAVAAKLPLKQRKFDSDSERKVRIHELQSLIAMIFAVTKAMNRACCQRQIPNTTKRTYRLFTKPRPTPTFDAKKHRPLPTFVW